MVLQLNSAVRYRVKKITVMRNDNDSAPEIADKALEPFSLLDVEMVGRFVEQKQVRAGQQKLCKAQL